MAAQYSYILAQVSNIFSLVIALTQTDLEAEESLNLNQSSVFFNFSTVYKLLYFSKSFFKKLSLATFLLKRSV